MMERLFLLRLQKMGLEGKSFNVDCGKTSKSDTHPYRDNFLLQGSSNSRGALFHLIDRIDAMTAGITIRAPIATYAKKSPARSLSIASVSVLPASSWANTALNLRLSGIRVSSITAFLFSVSSFVRPESLSVRSSSLFSFSSSAILTAEFSKSVFSLSFVCRNSDGALSGCDCSGRGCAAANCCVGVDCRGAGCAPTLASADGEDGSVRGESAADANKARHWDRRSARRGSEGRIARGTNDWTL